MMSTEPAEVLGPIDFLILEFDSENATGEAAAAMLDLVERGIVRIWDVLIVQKEADGTFSGVDLVDLSADGIGGFAAFSGARSGLLGDEDIAEAANAMEPGKMAALIVYENAWAVPFVAAAHRMGAQVIASARIPADEILAALDELDASDA
jgi:uncharacterized membrane protein